MAELSGLTGWKLLKAIRGRKDAVHNNEGVAIVSRHDADGTTYVRLPGSTFDTPVNGTNVVATEMGDEVSYTIRDGRLSITGSTSNPAVGASQMQNSIHQVETTVENIRTAYIEADQVQAKELAAEKARIGELEADNVTINGKLDAAEANITNLQATALTADSATITDLQADTAKVHNLTADQLSTATAYVGALTAEGVTAQDVIADHGDFDTVKANAAKVENLTAAELEADHAKVGRIDVDQIAADHATVGAINADYLKAADMQAEQARVGTLLAGKADVTDLTAATARIDDLEADHVSVDDFEAEQGYIDALQAATADIATIRADSAKVHSLTAAQLSAATAYIAALNADNITAASLSADVGKIHNLTANEISAAAAYIAALNADSVTAQNIIAMNGDFATVKANAAKVANLTAAQLEADHATVGSLDANYAQINMANVNNAWIANGTIKDGAISNGMINSVSANKLTAGTIDASNITVTNLNADNITTGTINGQRIGEGSLSLSKLEEDVYTETEVNNIVSNLQTQIDGAIETWTGTAVPTLSNSPASSWTTNAIKDTHVGDVYFVVNSQSQQNGYNYRFTKSGSTYSWQLIKDSDVTNALQRLTTAEGKITTFDSDISQLKTDTGTLTTKTTSLETRMSDAEADILDKVDTTTFNEVSDTVDSHSQSISQMSTTLSNKADSSTVSAVTQRVSKNEQDISGINTTIGTLTTTVESKADSSTVETMSTKLNTVSDTVDGHTQSISSITSTQTTMQGKLDKTLVETTQLWFSKADTTAPNKPTTQVTSTATTGNAWTTVVPAYNASYPNYYYCYQWKYSDGTYGWSAVTRDIATGEMQATSRKAQSDIDNLEIGGRNLLGNTSYLVDGTDYTGKATAAWAVLLPANHIPLLEEITQLDEQYVLSFDARVSGASIRVQWRFNYVSTSGTYKDFSNTPTYLVNSTDWVRYSITLKTPNTRPDDYSRSAIIVQSQSGSTTDYVEVRRFKLEHGTKATDWTPAPEDVDANISTAQISADNAQATADKNIKESQQLWFTKANGSAPNKPTSKVTSTSTSGNAWTTKVPTYSSSYPYYFYCMQYIAADGTVTWSDVVYDQATTEAQSVARTTSANLSTLQSDYATFKQTTQNFESTIGTTYATKTELSSAKRVGRNLLRWTAHPRYAGDNKSKNVDSTGWYRWSSTVTVSETDFGIRLDFTGNNTGLVIPFIDDDVISGQTTYTLSFDYRGNCSVDGTIIYALARSGSNFYVTTNTPLVVSETDWQHFEATFAWPTFGERKVHSLLVPYNGTNGKWLEIRYNSMQLEHGSVATIWSPAVEDENRSMRFTLLRSNWNETSWAPYSVVGHTAGWNPKSPTASSSTYAIADCRTLNVGDTFTVTGVSTDKSITHSIVCEVTSVPTAEHGDIPAKTIAVNDNSVYAKAVESRVSTAETSIQQNTNSIALKANSSDVYTKTQTDGLISTEVSNRNSAIEQSANAINLSVSQTYTTKTEFNALEVGGNRYYAPWDRDVSVKEFGYLGVDQWKSTGQKQDFSKNFVMRVEFKRSSQYQSQRYCLASPYGVVNPGTGSMNPEVGIELAGNTNQVRIYSTDDSGAATDKYTGFVPAPDIWTTVVLYWNASASEFSWFITNGDQTNTGSYAVSAGSYRGVSGEVWIGSDSRHNSTWNCAYEQCDMPAVWYEDVPEDTDYICYWNDEEKVSGEQTGVTEVIRVPGSTMTSAMESAISEIRTTAEGITSTVEKISSAKYLTSTVGGWSLANIKVYGSHDTQTAFTVASTDGVRVGDTVYIKGTDTTRSCTVYIKGVVKTVNSATSVTIYGRGYEDILPVESIKSTINQSADSVKIQAKHVEIDGAAIFSNTAFKQAADAAYDAKGSASAVQTNLDNLEIGGRNLLLQSDYQSSLTRNGITFTNNSDGSVTANGTATALAVYCFALSKTFDAGTYTLSGCPPTGSDSAYRLDLLSVPVSSGNAAVVDYGDGVTFKTIGGTTGECRFRVASGATVSNITIYPKLEKGNRATDWTPAPEDVAPKASAVTRTQRIYYRKSASGAPGTPGSTSSAWVSQTGNVSNAWTTMHVPISSTEKFIYTCEQRQFGDGNIAYTSVLLDNTITVIDGGNIITGSIAANKLDVYDATIGKISTSAINLTGYAQTDDIPTKVSDLTNDSGFQDSSQVETAITSKGYATQTSLNSEINQRKAHYGTCSTAAATQAKAVTCSNFELVAGNELTVKFSTANTYASGAVQLNVNSKGAKNVWVSNAVTSASNQLLWGANAYITFRYDGTQFIAIGEPRTWYGASTTAESTAAKTDTTAVTGCVICKGAKVELAMTNANTATAPTLNIQSTGAKNVYFGNGTARPTKADGTSWLATNTCTFTFDGQYWRTAGKTYIDANSIVTGYLSADRIEAGSLSANKISATSGTFDTANIPNLSSDKITVGGSTLTSNLSDKDSAIADAAKHTQVIISATNVNYDSNTCTLTARLYIDGVLQTSTSLKWQWYRDGTTQGSQTTGATGSLAVTSSLGLAHRYACKCTF